MHGSNDISVSIKPAGGPFQDPAVLLSWPNQKELVLLDCGTLHSLKTRDLLRVRWLFVTHFHIDHFIGFDHLLRLRLFSDVPLTVFGPPGSCEILAHRLQGYSWNLTSGSPFVVRVVELPMDESETGKSSLFRCHNCFLEEQDESFTMSQRSGVELLPDLHCFWRPVNHGVPCLAYRLEKTFVPKFSLESCKRLGLKPGPWIKELEKNPEFCLEVDGQVREASRLKAELMQERPPERLGYLTDTLLDEELSSDLSKFFHEGQILICETAYRAEEEEMARQNLHMTTKQVAEFANKASISELKIFHLSRRHLAEGPERHLQEVREIFPATQLLAD